MNRNRPGLRLLPLALALALLGGACSSSASDSEPTSTASELSPGGTIDASPGAPIDATGPDAIAPPGGGDGQGGSTDAGGGAGGGQGGSAGDGAERRNGPPPMDFPYKTPVSVEAVLEPTCVERGERVTLQVTSEPEAAIVYNAVYSDGFGGSGPPFGKNYGGNDKGYTSDGGTYQSFWVVSLDAPEGRARVDVVVGYEGEWGYDGPHFAVADEAGNCPRKWLESEEPDPN